MSAEGVVTLSSFAAAGVAVRSAADEPVLAAVYAVVEPALELYDGERRGYRVGVASVAPSFTPSPARVMLQLALAQSPLYVDVALVPVQSPTQLASSLVALLGLVGAYAVVFAAGEDWCRRSKARDSRCWRRCCRVCRCGAERAESTTALAAAGAGAEASGGKGVAATFVSPLATLRYQRATLAARAAGGAARGGGGVGACAPSPHGSERFGDAEAPISFVNADGVAAAHVNSARRAQLQLAVATAGGDSGGCGSGADAGTADLVSRLAAELAGQSAEVAAQRAELATQRAELEALRVELIAQLTAQRAEQNSETAALRAFVQSLLGGAEAPAVCVCRL